MIRYSTLDREPALFLATKAQRHEKILLFFRQDEQDFYDFLIKDLKNLCSSVSNLKPLLDRIYIMAWISLLVS